MYANEDIKAVKSRMIDAVAMFGEGTRAEAVKSVMSEAMTIRNALVNDSAYQSAKKLAEGQKKLIDSCQSLIKDGMNAIGIDEFEADGTTAKFSAGKFLLLSEVARVAPQELLEFIKDGGLDGVSLKDEVDNQRLKDVITASTQTIQGALRFKD